MQRRVGRRRATSPPILAVHFDRTAVPAGGGTAWHAEMGKRGTSNRLTDFTGFFSISCERASDLIRP